MSALSKHKLYVTAAALLLGAIAAGFLAKLHAGRGMMALARRAEKMNSARATGLPMEETGLRDEAAWHVRRSGLWDVVGLGLAALGIAFGAASCKRCEPGPPGVLLLLFGVYVLLLLLLV
jgi:hypothetical protein